jgi:hypothetical protein
VRVKRQVRLSGRARTRFDRERAETVLRGLKNRAAYSSFRIRNEVSVEP